MPPALSKVPPLSLIQSRLPKIFPEGTENRAYLVRNMAAKTIFVMFYTGAIEGSERWIRPDQVTKMSESQSEKTDEISRVEWSRKSVAPGEMKHVQGRWYSVNTREPIRDETLRMGLVMFGAVVEKRGVPTTSSKPRYALDKEFAGLFDDQMRNQTFQKAVKKWQLAHLSDSALVRMRLRDRSALAAKRSHILVTLPNGETRRMAPGPSSVLSKAVIEDFTKRFINEPALIFLSESGNKVVAQDYHLARSIGLSIHTERNLPDIVLADIGLDQPLIIFVEVVITDGAITRSRKEALLKVARDAGFPPGRTFFVSAFEDRDLPAYRRLSSNLGWGSLVWFATEPNHLIVLTDKEIFLESLAKLSKIAQKNS